MGRKAYPSDVTDRQWQDLEGLIPAVKSGGRPAKWSRREIVNAILYVGRTGCAWRALPHDFPPYTTVYDYFRAWRDSAVWERVNQALRERVRMKMGRHAQPSLAVVDSQSVPTTSKGGFEAMTSTKTSKGVNGIF